jgi:hypothetical protein
MHPAGLFFTVFYNRDDELAGMQQGRDRLTGKMLEEKPVSFQLVCIIPETLFV